MTDKAMQRALASLDELSDSAIRRRILGAGEEGDEEEAPSGEMPMGEEQDDGEEISPELLEKLKAALAAE